MDVMNNQGCHASGMFKTLGAIAPAANITVRAASKNGLMIFEYSLGFIETSFRVETKGFCLMFSRYGYDKL